MEIVAEGEALIENDDLTFARQIALRRAMASAVEQAGGFLQATTVSTPLGVQERTSLTGGNRVLGSRIVAEFVDKGKIRLTAEVRLDEPGRPLTCGGIPRRKAVVTAFPLQFPEQVGKGEYVGWPQATAEELAGQLNRAGRLLAASAASEIPFASAAEAPEPMRKEGVPLLVNWARAARAQYVVGGVFRDFGGNMRALVIPERQMTIEAFIYDGFSGEVLARQTFTRQQIGFGGLSQTTSFGGRDFRESRLGQLYFDLLREMGAWSENAIACLPFAARVVQVNGTRLHLDVGSDSGLEPGMEFLLTREGAISVGSPEGERLGRDRVPVAGVIIKSVYPRYSVAEITAKKNPPTARVGDVLFGP